MPGTVLRKEKFKFCGKNGLHLKLKNRKDQKMILSERLGDPYGRTEDRCRIRESWHVCTVLKDTSGPSDAAVVE